MMRNDRQPETATWRKSKRLPSYRARAVVRGERDENTWNENSWPTLLKRMEVEGMSLIELLGPADKEAEAPEIGRTPRGTPFK